MAAVIHSLPAPARWRQEGRASRQPERESFVHEIVNGILANKRPERAAAASPRGDAIERISARQLRNIATRMRKKSGKFICGISIVAQNQPPGIKFELRF